MFLVNLAGLATGGAGGGGGGESDLTSNPAILLGKGRSPTTTKELRAAAEQKE